MDVSSIGSSASVYSVDPSQLGQSAPSAVSGDSAPADVSKMGDLMKQLQQLSQSDPAKFKQVTAEISNELKSEASSATGKKAAFLNDLAGKFQQASQSGDMSALQPPQQQSGAHAHHGHGHHAHVSAYQSNSGAQQDPSDSLAQLIQGALQGAQPSA
jgi:hypothetical protein